MNYLIMLIMALCVVWSAVSSTSAVAQLGPLGAAPSSLVFTHVTVIDATGAPAQPDMTVIIHKDRIQAVGKTGVIPIPQEAQVQVIDASRKFLIPGL